MRACRCEQRHPVDLPGASAFSAATRSPSPSSKYPPGSRMPTHRELAVLYDMGMTTITNVMRVLRERRLVVGRQGKAVYVVERLPPKRHPS